MAKSGIKLNLKGFEELLQQIDAAGKDAGKAAENAIKASAEIVETELRAQAAASDVPDDITSEIRTKTSSSADRYEAEVGWHLDSYQPKKPSAGYKAIFLNYGTVRRKTRRGYNRGEIPKRARNQQFIYMAKKNSQRKVKALQKEMLEKVLGDLK